MRYKHKTIIANNFSKYHENYDLKADLQRDIAQDLAAMLPEMSPRARILEIGCGTGFLTSHLFEKYPDATFDITDLSDAMVLYCQKNHPHPNANFFVMDGENPSNTKESYDLIVSSMAVQWFQDPLVGLNTLNKLGPIYYATLGHNSFHEWKTALQNLNLPNGTLEIPDWPHIEEEKIIPRHYKNAEHFLKTLKEIGTASPKKDYSTLSYSDLRDAMEEFDKCYQGSISWHVAFGKIPLFSE